MYKGISRRIALISSIESFRVYAVYALPMPCPHMYFYISSHHDPMILIPDGKAIRAFNISHFKPKTPPEFPLSRGKKPTPTADESDEGDDSSELAATMSRTLNVDDRGSGDDEDDNGDDPKVVYPVAKPVKKLLDEVPGWVIDGEPASEIHAALPDIEQCEMGWGGKAIIGVGKRGTLWQWKLRERRP